MSRIAIVGAGLMGMALAQRLTSAGHQVVLYERETQVGGLSTYHDYGEFFWDRFYHVILPSDQALIGFLQHIGLGEALQWRPTRTGFYVHGRMHSISTSIEFLRFPLLGLVGKARLAWTLFYGSRINNWRVLEQQTVEQWLRRLSGRATFEVMWLPLLKAKLGEHYKRTSAVFIWSYIKRLFSARDKSIGKEQLGHVKGGYRSVFMRLSEIIEANGGQVRTGTTVNAVVAAEQGGMQIHTQGKTEHFDKVVCTSPVPVLERMLGPGLIDVQGKDGQVEYLGVVVVVLVTRVPVLPYYVVNIADESLPFTGVIGMSNVVDARNTGGRYLTYLPRYVLADDPFLAQPDEVIREQFLAAFSRLLPAFDPQTLCSVHVNRARQVQPLQTLGYSTHVPQVRTRHNDLFVLNTTQFVNATLNNNEVINAVNAFVDQHGEHLSRVSAQATLLVSQGKSEGA